MPSSGQVLVSRLADPSYVQFGQISYQDAKLPTPISEGGGACNVILIVPILIVNPKVEIIKQDGF